MSPKAELATGSPPKAGTATAARRTCTDYTNRETVDEFCARTTPYAKAWAEPAKRLWLEQHPTGKKNYADAMSSVSVDDKAKIIAEEDARMEGRERLAG